VEAEELVSEEFLDKILDGQEKLQKDNFNKKGGIKRASDKSSNDKGIIRKYLTLLFKSILIIIGITLMVILHLLIVKKSVEFLKIKQNQMYFSDYLRTQTYLHQIASQEIFSAPVNAEVENTQLETWTVESIQKMRNLKVYVSTVFQNEDGSYDPEIKDIVFENGCPSGVLVNNQEPCSYLAQKSMKNGLVYLLSSLEDILNTRLNKYQQSDKSAQALRDIEGADFEALLVITLVIVQQCYVITQTISANVDKSLAQSDEKKTNHHSFNYDFIFASGCGYLDGSYQKVEEKLQYFKKGLESITS